MPPTGTCAKAAPECGHPAISRVSLTQILSCVATNFVVQVSDRRVSLADGSSFEDVANKAIFFMNHSTWAYTGLAQLGRRRMDEWLVERMRTYELHAEATNAIATGLTERLAVLRLGPTLKRVAVVGVGFAQFAATIEPFLAVISNFHIPIGQWAPAAVPVVTARVWPLGDGLPIHLSVAGQPLTHAERAQTKRLIGAAISKGSGPHAVARILTAVVQKVAARNVAVGPNVVASIVTRRGSELGSDHVGTVVPVGPNAAGLRRFQPPADWNGEPQYIYSPGAPEATVFYGPAVVARGITWSGVMLGPQDRVAVEDRGPFPPYRLERP
jgi:limonene-1,2-epoxide hydrolase